jgi:ABC-2 type transport system ATP-binding protein
MSKESKPMIQTVNAARWYGQIGAVNDVSLELGAGITGLLGPNGAGKSTLMKMMVGQLRPSKGEVKVLGERVFGNRALMRRIGYCPEHEGTYEDLTGLELVTALNRLHGIDPAESKKRAEDMLARLDLADAMHRRLGEYSKGMRQRAKLAQAMAHDPEVIFLDEPLTGCDPIARVKVLEVVKALGDKGCCVVVSSHVLYEIEAMTSEIVLIHKGQVLAEGDIYAVRDLIDKHPHKVRIECDRPRELARALVDAEHVLTFHFEPSVLTIDTREPDRCYPAIPEAARKAGVTIAALTSPDNNLQAVFRYLTEDREKPGAKGARTTPAAQVQP